MQRFKVIALLCGLLAVLSCERAPSPHKQGCSPLQMEAANLQLVARKQLADSLFKANARESAVDTLRHFLYGATCVPKDSLLAAGLKLGSYYAKDKEDVLALQAFQDGLKYVRLSGEWNDTLRQQWQGDFCHQASNQFAKLGAQDSAQHYAKLAIAHLEKYNGPKALKAMKAYTALAQAYMNKLDLAQADSIRSIVWQVRSADATATAKERFIAAYNLAEVKVKRAQLAAATDYLAIVQALQHELAPADSVTYAPNVLELTLQHWILRGDTAQMDAALKSWTASAALSADLGGQCQITIGDFRHGAHDDLAAMRHYSAALQSFLPTDVRLGAQLPSLWELGHNPNVFVALTRMARLQAASPDTNLHRAFAPTFDLAFQFLEAMRVGFGRPNLRAYFAYNADSEFQIAIRAALENGLPNKAFEWMERSKESELLEELQGLGRYDIDPLPDSTIQRGEALLQQLKAAANALNSGQPQAQRRLDSLQSQLAAMKDALNRHHPGHFKTEAKLSQIADVQSRLKGDSTLFLSYFWGPQYLIVAAMTHGRDTLFSVPLASNLDTCVRQMIVHLQAANDGAPALAEASHEVFLQAIQPVLDAFHQGKVFPRMVISPDGPLATLPFDALRTRQSPPDVAAFLLQQSVISYVPSATLFCAYDDRGPLPGGVLGIGSSGGFRGTKSLPHVSSEVLGAVGRLGGSSQVDALNMEENLKQWHHQEAILHIASHGEFDPDFPMDSRLLLQPAPEGGEDGDLHIFEILRMHFTEQLAVLSACETGVGKPLQGREVMSIGYAFQIAQCSTVVMSLWNVNDQATSAIMTHFYDQLAQGIPAAHAFSAARRSYLRAADPTHIAPRFWAPFVLSGNGELRFQPTSPSHPFPWKWIVAGSILASAMIALYQWRKRRKRKFRWV